jgi:hypothetical protein
VIAIADNSLSDVNIEGVSSLQATMARFECGTSIAF